MHYQDNVTTQLPQRYRIFHKAQVIQDHPHNVSPHSFVVGTGVYSFTPLPHYTGLQRPLIHSTV